jgi:hypothetical protein
MGIKVDSGEMQPAIVFDRVHVTNLQIQQPVYTDDNLLPKYHVYIEYKLYGVDVHMQRHYKPGSFEAEVEDFITMATELAREGNMALALALPSIEQAIATIIQLDIDKNARVV